MPTDQPSNAPDTIGTDAADDLNAASVIADENLDDTPGGGGLLGQSAADGEAAAHPSGGPQRNAAVDTGTTVADEAKQQVLGIDPAPEPHPGSQ